MRSLKSLLFTLLCTIVILGLGYLGIVERGRQILSSESVPERANYEDVGSNIFYGKIEDNIEIFPWNYYSETDDTIQGIIPTFMEEEIFLNQYVTEKTSAIKDDNSMDMGDTELDETYYYFPEQYLNAADSYFGELIAYETEVETEEVSAWFQKEGNHILENLIVAENTPVGMLFFYQDILQLRGKKYQVRIACSNWNVINFICVEYDTQDKRERTEWKAGKEKMVEVLEQSEESLSAYFSFMSKLNDLGAPSVYFVDDEYANSYLYGFQWLGNIISGRAEDDELSMEIEKWLLEWQKIYPEEIDASIAEGESVTYSVNYSYQVVELKDMILILVQGDAAMGLYFDPINQKFCGYNFFYEF